MYFAEKIIDGILHFKTTPNGWWKMYTHEMYMEKITLLEAELQSAKDTIEYLSSITS
jgi:hypothetical protein